MDAGADATLWYFAYGSNLDAGTFLGRRRMRPLETLVAVLEDFELRFDLPLGLGERGVANVAPREGDEVWGALYRLTHGDAERLDHTEGVQFRYYQRLAIEVRSTAGATIRAFTYHSVHRALGRKPSRRYLGLLLAGAQDLGLPSAYIERLRSLLLASDERAPQRLLP